MLQFHHTYFYLIYEELFQRVGQYQGGSFVGGRLERGSLEGAPASTTATRLPASARGNRRVLHSCNSNNHHFLSGLRSVRAQLMK